jgi:hypothetical protein
MNKSRIIHLNVITLNATLYIYTIERQCHSRCQVDYLTLCKYTASRFTVKLYRSSGKLI